MISPLAAVWSAEMRTNNAYESGACGQALLTGGWGVSSSVTVPVCCKSVIEFMVICLCGFVWFSLMSSWFYENQISTSIQWAAIRAFKGTAAFFITPPKDERQDDPLMLNYSHYKDNISCRSPAGLTALMNEYRVQCCSIEDKLYLMINRFLVNHIQLSYQI